MNIKKLLAIVLLIAMVLSLAACGTNETPPAVNSDPTVEPAAEPTPEPVNEEPTIFPWDNFEGRDPNSKPDTAPNGASMWWDNWANLRASAEDGVIKIQYRPKEFNTDDYVDENDYYARAGDWMGNWGEAIDMWSLEGIQYCKYLTIRIKGEVGGEENKLIMDWHPEDSRFYAARFSDLVLKDGSNPVITTEWQDLVIDLEKSGFPGMTNALHIRAFAECTIYLDELYFSDPVGPIDATSAETILAGFNVPESGKPADLPIKDFVAEAAVIFPWDNFEGRDPNSKPDTAPNGASMWWDNWANLRASAEDGVIKIQYRPKEFNTDDYVDENDYYARAGDWMGNWGEAIDMWSLEGIQYCKYLTIRIKGEVGGEENKLIMDWHPEDSRFYAARFSDLVLKDGSNPVITTEWQDLVIDLEKSGFPGMTNALHIRAFAECTIYLDELYFSDPVGPIDATSAETILAGFNVPESGKPADLPIKDFVAGS
ncbi:MAG: hypothetical protein BWY11_02094 [Firmicutes bacterium ADurb.Bin182]|nr:MAG: hypothetical protein BWY11_02094 [Firmicutes bacterium ADurb.Bin182]